MKYTHYGHDKFEKELFSEIINRKYFSKPYGGLWACAENYEYNWFKWCNDNDFHIDNNKISFEFEIKPDSKILKIHNSAILDTLPQAFSRMVDIIYLDFENLKENYDAIEVLISKDQNLYWSLYGWDCDSILIMNKDIIII